MSHPKPEWLAALADGELCSWRRWQLARHARGCPACAAAYRHQRHVREMLRQNPPAVAMSDSADFFWSKVRRDIERQTAATAATAAPAGWWARQQLRVAAAVAAAVVATGLVWVVGPARPAPGVQAVHTPLPDTTATVLPGPAQVTTVWISGLPWTSDMTEMQTLFANLDS